MRLGKANTNGAGPVASTFRYYRFTVVNVVDNSKSAILKFRGLLGGVDQLPLNMTSNVLPSPLVASASQELVGNEAYKAYAPGISADSLCWIPAVSGSAIFPIWNQIDLGAGNEVEIDEIAILSRNSSSRYPVDFKVEASNAGTFTGEQSLLGEWTGVTTGWSVAVWRFFTLP